MMTDFTSPLVSVVINCRNGERYLTEALESIKLQSYANIEVVVYDNASSDNSRNIVRNCGLSIKLIEGQEMLLLGSARNQAIKHVTGDFVCFLDCDDKFFPDKITRQISFMEESGADYSFHDVEIWDERTGTRKIKILKATPLRPRGDMLTDLLFNNFIVLSSLCVKRNLLLSVNGFEEDYNHSEDYDLLLKLAKISEGIRIPEPLGVYRLHKTNLTWTQQSLGWEECIQILTRNLNKKDKIFNSVLWHAKVNLLKFYLKEFNLRKIAFLILKEIFRLKF